MTRIALATAILVVQAACVHGELQTTYEAGGPIDSASENGPVETEELQTNEEEPTLDCQEFVTSPHNACDGHNDFEIAVTAQEAQADGSTLLTLSLTSSAEWMNYPMILQDGQDASTWYGIMAGDTYEWQTTIAADIDQVVFTSGALNCVNNQPNPNWMCPNPNPLIVDL